MARVKTNIVTGRTAKMSQLVIYNSAIKLILTSRNKQKSHMLSKAITMVKVRLAKKALVSI